MGNYKFRLSDMMPNAWFYKFKNGAAAQHHHHHPIKNNNKHKNLQYRHYLITPTPTPTSSTTPYHQTSAQISHPRHSYYFTREPYTKSIHTNDQLLPLHNSSSPTNPKLSDLHYIAPAESPRKPSKRSRPKSRRRTVNNKSVSSVPSSCNWREQLSSPGTPSKSDSTPDYSAVASPELLDSHESAESVRRVDTNSMSMSSSTTTSCSCRVSASTIDSKKSSSAEKFDPITELELPPIITKAPAKSRRRRSKDDVGEINFHGSLSFKEEKSSPFVRKSISAGSPGLKLRSNSPRILTRKVHSKQRTTTNTTGTKKPAVNTATTVSSKVIPVSSMNKNVSDSFAIIKSSYDPQRDFRESMVEMIVENNLRKSSELEELLACYLSLNSNEYHDIIVKVFEQIWFDLTDIH